MNKLKSFFSYLWIELKHAHKSLTMWLNGVALALTTALPELATELPKLQPYVPAETFRHVMMIFLIVAMAVRVKTNGRLSDKATPKDPQNG